MSGNASGGTSSSNEGKTPITSDPAKSYYGYDNAYNEFSPISSKYTESKGSMRKTNFSMGVGDDDG